MPSRRHADFSWRRQYRCADCQEVLTTGTSLIKRNFGAVADECTHLFKYIKNVRLGEEITRRFTDWLHVVNDVHCIGCDAQVGWKVLRTYDYREASQQGQFILEESWFERYDEPWEEVKARKAAERAERDKRLQAYREVGGEAPTSKRQHSEVQEDVTSTAEQEQPCTCGSKRPRRDVEYREIGVQATVRRSDA